MTTKYKKIYKFKKERSREFKDVFINNNEPNFHILTDPNFVEEIPKTGSFEVPDTAINAYNGAEIIHTALSKAGNPVAQYDNEIAMWEWLSYAFSLQLKIGIRGDKYGAFDRFSPVKRPPQGDWQTFMRHQLRTSVHLYDRFGNDAKVYLYNGMGIQGEMREQPLQTFPLVTQETCKLFNKIFWDDAEQNIKPGATDKELKNGYGVRFVVASIKRLRLTYNLEQMNADEVIRLLPEKIKTQYNL